MATSGTCAMSPWRSSSEMGRSALFDGHIRDVVGECFQPVKIAHGPSRRGPPRTRLLQRRAKPPRECRRLPKVEPATEHERASPQWLTHPRGKSINVPYLGTHRSQIM